MPQVRCPNCGLTINLENRKDVDVHLITNAIKHNASSFTKLLHVTKLPRKTLSMRLKELCQSGVLVKTVDGMYKCNGSSGSEESFKSPLCRLSNIARDQRIKGLVLLGLLLVAVPTASYVMAAWFSVPINSPKPAPEPQILGSFAATVDVHEVSDLRGWQVVITFNASELKVLSVSPSDFFRVDSPIPELLQAEYTETLILGSCLSANQTAVSGTGTLVTAVFGYFVENYGSPEIATTAFGFETTLLDSHGDEIPTSDPTLTLMITP